ncbi:nucleotidyltransferase domain-containing protein [Winogradskyella sp. A3E31]|uniref:nucleotidyltransferase domain-containing protein n=1 Tax=Winogradskyella sp. A3E31 TaxID=3349637 RepID=UPI00398A5B6D
MNVLKVIIYFSIFKYPLKKEEIFAFSSKQHIEDVEKELQSLLEKKIIYKLGDFYSDKNDSSLVERRLKGNKMALEVMPKALKSAKLIAAFPFVESVAISGALSKMYFDEEGDVDFFIITKPNHLWLSRTLLVLYKKVFLLNSKKYFCVNYFVGSSHLKIQEQNKFTATELVTLLPIYGKSIFSDFIKTNQWAFDFYPNKTIDFSFIKEARSKPIWSKSIELIFGNTLGERFDKSLKALTIKKWKSKFKHLDKDVFEIAMKSTNDVSKHHPQDFQSQVIVRLNKQYDDKNKAYNLNLSKENA